MSRLAAAALAGVAMAALATPAHASTTGSVYFVNGNDNPSSFACYRYVSGAWKKIGVASGATVSRSTPLKCNARWRARLIGGASIATTNANVVIKIGDAQTGPYNTVSAGKA